jgi:hypothetical protein
VDDFEVETVTRIHIEEATLEIGSDADTGELVEIRTPNAESVDYFGDIRLSLSPSMAHAVGTALIEQARRLKEPSRG